MIVVQVILIQLDHSQEIEFNNILSGFNKFMILTL